MKQAGPTAAGWQALDGVDDRRSSRIHWPSALGRRCDPYLAWEDAKALPGRGKSADEQSEWVTVLVQWRDLAAANRIAAALGLRLTHGVKATHALLIRAYRCRLGVTSKLMRHVGEEVLRFELEVTRSFSEAELQDDPEDTGVSSALEQGSENRRLAMRHPSPIPFVGVIDDVLNFRSHRWRAQGGQHMFGLLWDQSDSALPRADEKNRLAGPVGRSRWQEFSPAQGQSPRQPGAPGGGVELPEPRYGRALDHERLTQALPAIGDASAVDYQPYEYPRIGARPRRGSREAMSARTLPMRDWSHGAAVADLIEREAACVPAGRMMFASLPLPSTEDTSAGSLSGFVLDAIHHFLHAAKGSPLVVNISYGVHQGPHDGTSMFESGVRELLVEYTNLHVVLPAGNSHRLRTHRQALLRQDEVLSIPWTVMPDDRTDSFMEIWCHTPGNWSVTVHPPGPLPEARAEPGSASVLATPPGPSSSGEVHAALIFPKAVSQGEHGTMALVAVAPTFERSGRLQDTKRWRAAGLEGVWTVRVTNRSPQARSFHAWVLRDDAAPGGSRAARGVVTRQSYIADRGEERADPSSTINGLATLDPADPALGGRLLVVGAMRALDGGLSTYSAAGPALRGGGGPFGPNIVVSADLSMSQPGRLVSGSFGGCKRRLSGTSMAAAIVSGRLYRHLAMPPHPPASSFCGPAPVVGSDRPVVPAGSPAHAQRDLRGWFERVDFEAHPDPSGRSSLHQSDLELLRAK